MTELAPRSRATTITASALALVLAGFLAWLLFSPLRIEQRLPDVVRAAHKAIANTIGPQFAAVPVMDAVANALVFVAVGILAALIFPRRLWFLALLLSPAISIAAELAQTAFLPGRVGDVRDVIAATVGGAIGIALVGLCTFLFARRPREATS